MVGEQPGGSVPIIDVTSVTIEPNACPLEDPLNLTVRFDIKKRVEHPVWTCQYIVDIAHKRHQIGLGSFSVQQPYSEGGQCFDFHIDTIDVTVIKEKHLLNNVGLLVLCLSEGESVESIVNVNIVTQVSASAHGGLIRTMFNPIA